MSDKQLPAAVFDKVANPYAIPKKPPDKDPCKICIITVTCDELCEDKALFNLFDDGEIKKRSEIKIQIGRRK